VRTSIDWQNDATNKAPEERATVADLRLFIQDRNVTQHLLDGRVGDHVTVALYGLAHGLAHDWWTIFGARDRTFSLTRYRTGYLLPDIQFRFDGAAFDISANQKFYENPDLRFFGGPSEVMTRDSAEQCLSNFIEDILARLSAEGVADTSAALRWDRVLSSRRSDEARFCEAAGALGLDPYQIADEAAAFIEGAEHLFRDEALIEFVSGAGNVDKSRLLHWVEESVGTRDGHQRLPDLRPIIDSLQQGNPTLHNDRPWSLGYRKARAMRQILGLGQRYQFGSFLDLADKFGAGPRFDLAPKIDGIHALRCEHEDGTYVHLRGHGNSLGAPATHLFALARAIGDAACFPAPESAPINGLHDACRQAAGRAFAAEFLAPIDEIKSMLTDKRDTASIADAFGVSTMVIDRQIGNQDRIAQAAS